MQSNSTPAIDLSATTVFSIGAYQVEPTSCTIRHHTTMQKIEPRVMKVLECLAHRPGRVVLRDDLLTAAWGHGTPNDEGLTQAICRLRKVFGDRAKHPTVIETVPKVGYRLIAPVSIPQMLGDGKQGSSRGRLPLTANFGPRPQQSDWMRLCFALFLMSCALCLSYSMSGSNLVPSVPEGTSNAQSAGTVATLGPAEIRIRVRKTQ